MTSHIASVSFSLIKDRKFEHPNISNSGFSKVEELWGSSTVTKPVMNLRQDHAGGKAMLHYNERIPGNRDINLVLSYAPLGLVSALHTELTSDGVLIDTGCIRCVHFIYIHSSN